MAQHADLRSGVIVAANSRFGSASSLSRVGARRGGYRKASLKHSVTQDEKASSFLCASRDTESMPSPVRMPGAGASAGTPTPGVGVTSRLRMMIMHAFGWLAHAP